MEQGVVVSGIAYDKNVARISILGVPDVPGVLAEVFGALGIQVSWMWTLSFRAV